MMKKMATGIIHPAGNLEQLSCQKDISSRRTPNGRTGALNPHAFILFAVGSNQRTICLSYMLMRATATIITVAMM